MNYQLTRKAVKTYLVYVVIAVVIFAVSHLSGIVLRQYLRIINQAIIVCGFISVMVMFKREIPPEENRKLRTVNILLVLSIVLIITGIALQLLFGIDKESVVMKDDRKMIEVESSLFMSLERSYYSYDNVFWYPENPHYTEVYDDGDPNQYVYTDYYDEKGELIARIFSE